MRCKRIVIIGDSLAMPRPEEGVEYEDTYPYLLFKKGYEVINRSRRANDIKIQTIEQNILDDVIYLKPDVLVIHLGIVDCAPRIFKRYEKRIINILPSLMKKLIINICSKYRYFITKYRKITYVNEREFEENIIKIIETAKSISKQIIIIKILNTLERNDKRSYNFNKNIQKYNKILEKIANKYNIELIDPNSFGKNGLLKDGIHINKQMHQYLFNKIKEKI
jgi:lysophospholipase L1-like esterase